MFPNKGSRKITIDNRNYRWRVSNENDYLIFLCEASDMKGCILHVNLDSQYHMYWREFPEVENLKLYSVTPSLVKEIVSLALNLGWKPEQKGSTVQFNYSNETRELEKVII